MENQNGQPAGVQQVVARAQDLISVRQDFFVIDAGLPMADATARRLSEQGIALLMGRNDQPLELIAGTLEAVGGARALHIIAEGGAQQFQLGGEQITAAMLDDKAEVLARIEAALADAGNIQLHGRSAIEDGGDSLLQALIARTGVSV